VRVLLLFEWFDPEPTPKGMPFARELRDLGHEVEVLTGFPNYPGGRIYSGYRVRPRQVEYIDGIKVTRVALYPSHDRSAVRRILTYASFAASACVAGLCLVPRPDVILVNGPPPTVGVAAAIIGWCRRIPFVFDLQDVWPDTLEAAGMLRNARALSLVNRVCLWMYRQASAVAVQAPGMGSRLVADGVDPARIKLVYNWCAEVPAAEYVGPRRNRPSGDPTFEVLFAGNMGKLQALDSVLAAAALIKDSHPHIRFSFMGGGIDVPRLKQRAADQGLTSVHFLPRVPMAEVAPRAAQADALLVHLSDHPLFSITIPSKTQASMAAGKPVVVAVAGDAAALVREAGSGVAAEPCHPRSIADAVVHLSQLPPEQLAAMGQRGRQFYDGRLSLEAGVRAFSDVLDFACKRSASSR
jgi:glycosyltransferase involved in cell wall biosynthesis